MKKLCVMVLFTLLLTGCAAEDTFETMADDMAAPVMAQAKDIVVQLPEDAAAPAVESDSGRIYLCSDYEITVQTLEGGDLDATIQTVSGYTREAVTVMTRQQNGFTRHEFVWVSAGESGDMVGRAVVLDDGSYHYVLSVMADASVVRTHEDDWITMFASFDLV